MKKMCAAIGFIFVSSEWESTQMTESLSSREKMELLRQSHFGLHGTDRVA